MTGQTNITIGYGDNAPRPQWTVPFDPAGSPFHLDITWPNGVLNLSSPGDLLVESLPGVGGAAATGRVSWLLTTGESLGIPIGTIAHYNLRRFIPGGEVRSYAAGLITVVDGPIDGSTVSITGSGPQGPTGAQGLPGLIAIANAAIYASTSAGIAGTTGGQYFCVQPSTAPGGGLFDIYKNVSGTATFLGTTLAADANLLARASGKNLFDPAQVTHGFEVYGDGTLSPEAQSAVSGFIYVPAGTAAITIQGTQASAAIAPGLVWLADDTTTIVRRDALSTTGATQTVAPPASLTANGGWFRFSPKQRNAAADSFGAIQIEFGSAATSYQAFGFPLVTRLFSRRLYAPQVNITYTGQKNLFDPSTITAGYEVYGDGSLSPQAQSAASDFIPVGVESYITVSGLQPANGFANCYAAFYAADKSTAIQAGILLIPGTAKSLPVPVGAVYFRCSVYQRNADAPNVSAVQIEYGATATAYAAYARRPYAINGDIIERTYLPTIGSAALKFLIFGDSKTETATLGGGSVAAGSYTEGTRENWPKYAMPLLRVGSWFNYAKSGASYCDFAGHTLFQNVSDQIIRAHNDARAADVVIISLGTNDISALISATFSLGSYATAMSKGSLAALDRTLFFEAMRWAFWQIRTYWPYAKCFANTPQQRADLTPEQMTVYIGYIKQMAARYDFTIFDAQAECGIVADFEVNGAQGRYLIDGLHETTSASSTGLFLPGTLLMGNWMATKLKTALQF
jgi:lysophospholipase L1-like esterase